LKTRAPDAAHFIIEGVRASAVCSVNRIMRMAFNQFLRVDLQFPRTGTGDVYHLSDSVTRTLMGIEINTFESYWSVGDVQAPPIGPEIPMPNPDVENCR
jgi:hypothetical protein